MRNEFFSLLVGVIASSVQRQRLYWKKNGINSYYFPFEFEDTANAGVELSFIELKDPTYRPDIGSDNAVTSFVFDGISIDTPIVTIKPEGTTGGAAYAPIDVANTNFTFDSIAINNPIKVLDGAAIEVEVVSSSFTLSSITINDPLKYGNPDIDKATVGFSFDLVEIS